MGIDVLGLGGNTSPIIALENLRPVLDRVLAVRRRLEHVDEILRELIEITKFMQQAEPVMRHQRLHNADGGAEQWPAAGSRLDGDDPELLVLRREQYGIAKLVIPRNFPAIGYGTEENHRGVKAESADARCEEILLARMHLADHDEPEFPSDRKSVV